MLRSSRGMPMVMAKGHDSRSSYALNTFLLIYLLSSVDFEVKSSKDEILSFRADFKKSRNRLNLLSIERLPNDDRHFELATSISNRPCKRRFTKSSCNYYSNSDARFQLKLVSCGDIHPNPGPSNADTKPKCSTCCKTVRLANATKCANCGDPFHKKCTRLKVGSLNDITWHCPSCVSYLNSFPFAFMDIMDSTSENIPDTNSNSSFQTIDPLSEFSTKFFKNLKLGHLNINSLGGCKFFEIYNLLNANLLDILVIGESKLNASFASSQFHVPGYKLFRKDRSTSKSGGGIVIYVKSELQVQRHANLECTKVESIVLKLDVGSSNIALLGAYRPPNLAKSIWTKELSQILENVSTIAKDIVLLGDLNCDLLQPDHRDKDGRALLDICDLFDLHCLIKSPTRITDSSSTLIDVILTNNHHRFLQTAVIESHLSDHKLICTAMRYHPPRSQPKFMTYRKIKDLNKDQLIEDLTYTPFHISYIFDDIDDIHWAWQKMYTDVINDHMPLKKVKLKGKQVPFMNRELRRAIRLRKQLWNKYKKTGDPDDHYNYKKQRNLTVKLRRKAIASHFRNTTNNANENPREFWKTFKPFLHTKGSKSTNDIFLQENGKVIKDRFQVSQIFNDYFVNICSSNNLINSDNLECHPSILSIKDFMISKQNLQDSQVSYKNLFVFENVTSLAVSDIIKSFKTSKSPGFDNINSLVVKLTSEAIIEPLTELINMCIHKGDVPLAWKSGQVTPIFKSYESLDKRNYRPISIVPIFDAIFEKCIYRQLYKWFDRLLVSRQSAFRKYHGCDTALIDLIENWKYNLDNKRSVGVVSLDLSKAFDSLPLDLLLAKLEAYGLSSKSIALIKNFLFERRQRVKICDTFSEWSAVSRGVPQGSVLGPLLFNIFVNDYHFCITKTQVNTYADDNQLHFSHECPMTIESTINDGLQESLQWFSKNSLKANPDKFQSFGLAPGRLHVDFKFKVANQELQQKNSIKLLGVTIDNALNFHEHIAGLCRKISRQISVFNRFKRLIPLDAKSKLYNSFILSHLNYCATVWHFCLKSDSDKLERLNERVLRSIYQDKNSDYHSLLIKANKTTLYNRRLQNITVLVFKALNDLAPSYINDLFSLRATPYNLRGSNILNVPKSNTTTYGLKSIRYLGPKLWNSLKDNIRTSNNLSSYKNLISKVNLASHQ